MAAAAPTTRLVPNRSPRARAFRAVAAALCCLGASGGAVDAPARVAAIVTGDPAGAPFVTSQIDAAVARAVVSRFGPGATARVTALAPAPEPLDRGFHTSFQATVDIEPGDGSAAFETRTTVDVDNVDVPGFAPRTLAFRDDPERIVADGVLSRTTVAVGRPTRLYYYHQNMATARRFCVVLSANDSVVTHVHVVGAAAGPNVDVMSVGHAATRTFLRREPHDEGRIVTIAGGKPVLERDERAGVNEVLVGALDLDVLDGGPVTVTVLAVPPGGDPLSVLYAPKLPDDGHARHGDFDLAGFAQWIVAYTVGGPDAAYVYGSRRQTPANLDPAAAGHDFGDYGVLQRVTFDVANPTDAPATLYLYEKPVGGVVRSSFVVDGSLVEVGCARVARRYRVTSYGVAAHATAALDVLTMTDGGSNYPLEIGLTATPPLDRTPPISAPDGCFPKPASSAVK